MVIVINPKENSERENYKLLIGSIIPRPIALVTTVSKEGILNAAPFSYFNIVSSNPPMVSLAIQRKEGKRKDTARNIYENKQFVIHIVDEDNLEKVNKSAANLPSNESEVDFVKFTQVESVTVSVPGIKQSKIRMECQLVQAIPLGEKGEAGDLFIGEVTLFHIDESVYENGYINPRKLNAISRLAGSDYATIGGIITMERPK